MKRTVTKMLVLAGVVFLITGFSLLAIGDPVIHAQDFENADYVGAGECESCHQGLARDHEDTAHGQALVKTNRRQDAILADFSVGEDARLVTLPGSDAAHPFTIDDIAYVIGDGQGVQNYVYEGDDDVFLVLPAAWNIESASWQPLNWAGQWPDPAYDFTTQCVGCHATGYNPERVRWEDDGVQCEACHGPGENHLEANDDAGRNPSEEELAAIRSSVNPAVDPQVCGQCHSRGTGQDAHAFPIGYLPGQTLTDTVTAPAQDDTAFWWPSGHARQMNMQYNEWVLSGHGSAFSILRDSPGATDDCLTCHSADARYAQHLIDRTEAGDREGAAPAPATMDTAQFGVTCFSCHSMHSETDQPAQLIADPVALCESCHSNASFSGEGIHHPAQEMYEGTALVEGIEAIPGTHFVAEDGPTCATCHVVEVPIDGGGMRDSHALQLILPGMAASMEGVTDTCSACHSELVDAANLQALIDDIQASTRERVERARTAVTSSTPAWVTHALDFVEGEGSFGVHHYVYSDALLDAVFTELRLFGAQ